MSNKKILGIRTSPTEIRYALLETSAGGHIDFINCSSESKLQYPATHTTAESKLHWLKSEIDRIFRQSPGVTQVIIKTNEFSRAENKAKRESAYADAICILSAAEHNIPVICKLYTQIGTTSKDVKLKAESMVGRTEKYWDTKIADAIMAAYSAR